MAKRQPRLPGTEGPNEQKPIKDLEDVIESYNKTASALSKARKKMGEVKEAFFKQMREHKVESYAAEDGKTYMITTGKEKITVIEPSGDEADDDEAGADE